MAGALQQGCIFSARLLTRDSATPWMLMVQLSALPSVVKVSTRSSVAPG